MMGSNSTVNENDGVGVCPVSPKENKKKGTRSLKSNSGAVQSLLTNERRMLNKR